MTPDDALAILDAAASSAPLTRAQHQTVMQALNTLGALIHPPQATTPPSAPQVRIVPKADKNDGNAV